MDRDPATLDPSNPTDAEAACNLLDSPGAIDPALRPFVARALRHGGSARVRAHAEIVTAFHTYAERRVEEAIALYRSGLRVLWGSGTAAERNACVNLGSASAGQGRVFESLVFARRGLLLANAAGQTHGRCTALMAILKARGEMGDWRRFDTLAPRVAKLIADLDDEMRMHFELVLLDGTVLRGDVTAAREHLSRARELSDRMDPRVIAELHAKLLLLEGDADTALLVAQVARATVDRHDQYDDRLLYVETRARTRLGSRAAAREAVTKFLDRLRRRALETLPGGRRASMAAHLARLAERTLQDRALAAAAYDIAGAATLERMVEIERFRQEFPELQHLDDDDARALEGYRERFLSSHARLLEQVSHLFAGDPDAVRVFCEAGTPRDAVLRICAWCRRVRGPEGLWVPVRDVTVEVDGALEVSHGICEPCRTTAETAAHGRPAALGL